MRSALNGQNLNEAFKILDDLEYVANNLESPKRVMTNFLCFEWFRPFEGRRGGASGRVTSPLLSHRSLLIDSGTVQQMAVLVSLAHSKNNHGGQSSHQLQLLDPPFEKCLKIFEHS